MFKKLVTNLPFNPSLINQVSFYTDRLHKERVIRGAGFILIIFSMFVQTFAVVNPPERSLAASSNHIINGIKTKQDILSAWDAAGSDVPAIYGLFGVTRADIEALPDKPNASINTGDADYWSIGRNSLTGYSGVADVYKNAQISIQFAGKNTASNADDQFIYQRQLKAWDRRYPTSTYSVFKGTISATGETFWILVDCGNLTTTSRYIPPPEIKPQAPTATFDLVCEPESTTASKITVKISNGSDPDGANNLLGGYKFWVDGTGSDGSSGGGVKYESSDAATSYSRTVTITNGSHTFFVHVLGTGPDGSRDGVNTYLGSKTVESCAIKKPEPPKPSLEITKYILDKPSYIQPGETFTYIIQYRNKVDASLATNVKITDELDIKNFDVVKVEPAETVVSNTGFLELNINSLQYSSYYKQIKVTVRVKDQVSSGTELCNVARITADNSASQISKQACLGVLVPCPYDSSIDNIDNPNCAEPKLTCELLDTAINRTTRKATFKTTVSSTNPRNTFVKGYSYDFGDDTELSYYASNKLEHTTSHNFEPGSYDISVTVSYRTTGQTEANDKTLPCTSSVDFDADQPLGQSKSVKNITQDKNGEAAINSELKPGDVVEYSLTTTNNQNYERTDVVVSDYIGDILDYAQLDEEFLQEKEATYNKDTKKIIWENVSIPAMGQINHVFRVKINDPIPATNSPSNLTTGFDCKISNEYGNEITINIDCPAVKSLESLPNTGPGSSILMMSSVSIFVGYFFARSRLLEKEMRLVRSEYTTTGGM